MTAEPAPNANLSVGSRRLADALIGLGIGPRKSATQEPWNGPEDLMPHYWRGLFDGDGSLARKSADLWTVFLCGSEPCVRGVQGVGGRGMRDQGHAVLQHRLLVRLDQRPVSGAEDRPCPVRRRSDVSGPEAADSRPDHGGHGACPAPDDMPLPILPYIQAAKAPHTGSVQMTLEDEEEAAAEG